MKSRGDGAAMICGAEHAADQRRYTGNGLFIANLKRNQSQFQKSLELP